MIVLSRGKKFRLPRLGKDVFAKLMRAKLKYDKNDGSFEITEETDLTTVSSILKAALNEQIILELQCIICSKGAGCAECEYASMCSRASDLCICNECLSRSDAYENYKEFVLQRLKFN